MPIEKVIDGIEYELYLEDERYDAVRYQVDELIQYFNPSFLDSCVDNDVLERIHRDFAESYVTDIEWESNQYGSNRLANEMDERGVSSKEEFIEQMANDGISEGIEYFTFNFGLEEGINMLVNAEAFDMDEVTQLAIDTDGYAHFLGRYDGIEHEFEIDGVTYYGYRV